MEEDTEFLCVVTFKLVGENGWRSSYKDMGLKCKMLTCCTEKFKLYFRKNEIEE